VRQTEYDRFDSWGHLHHYVDRHTELNTNTKTIVHTDHAPIHVHSPWYTLAETNAKADASAKADDEDAEEAADEEDADESEAEAEDETDAEGEDDAESDAADAELVETDAAADADKPGRIRVYDNMVVVGGRYGRSTTVHIDPIRDEPIRRHRHRRAVKVYSGDGYSIADNGPVDYRLDQDKDAFEMQDWGTSVEPSYAAGSLNPATPYVYKPEARTVTFSTAPHDVMQQEAQAKIVITN